MSRFLRKINEHTTVITGHDHALGHFIDIIDKRYANTPLDEQGEGYVFEWSQFLGITTNLIKAEPEDVQDEYRLLELTELFILKNNY